MDHELIVIASERSERSNLKRKDCFVPHGLYFILWYAGLPSAVGLLAMTVIKRF